MLDFYVTKSVYNYYIAHYQCNLLVKAIYKVIVINNILTSIIIITITIKQNNLKSKIIINIVTSGYQNL